MQLCEYGCGKEAKYQFKNGKWCCSKNHKSCSNLTYPTKINIGKTECPYCKKLISNNRIKKHMKVCIKYNKCLQCGKETKNPKFCNASCSAKYHNKKRKIKRYCLYCLKPVKNKYCNNVCASLYIRDEKIKKWLNGEIEGKSAGGHALFVKQYLLEKYDNKCSRCGWSEKNIYTNTIPLEVEHIDGNAYNNIPENVTLLCPNCQALTSTYRGANKGNGRRAYLKKYYIRSINGKII